MAKVQVDTLVIYSSKSEEVLVSLHGKGVGVYQLLKKHPYWDTIQEDLSDLEIATPNTLEELAVIYSLYDLEPDFIILRDQLFFY